MLLSDLVRISRAVAATRSRLAKSAAIADALRAAEPGEVEVVAAYLGGAPRQRRTGLGWRGLAQLPEPATSPSLTVADVDAALEHISTLSGAGSQSARASAVVDLFGRATADEQIFLRALIFENLRQGALDSVLLDAIATAADVPLAAVRRAAMFSAVSGPIAAAALSGGEEALLSFSMEVGRPVRPMLASPATSMEEAVAKLSGSFAADAKLDGIRLQVHRSGQDVALYTRSLDEITDRLPEVVEAVLALDVDSVVLDGEVIALRPDGRPRPFQETASRTGSTGSVEALRDTAPVTPYFFDVLHLDGEDLIDCPASERFAKLAAALPDRLVVPRLVTDDAAAATRFFDEVVAQGHEGVVVKDLSSPYDAGRRGSAWLKVKPRHTLDLVVLAVEWGSGRREGWLSNIHLGARDPEVGGFVMLGKTFKGMTDEMLAWQTERFLELETGRSRHVVTVRPEQVVEIAFDGVQRSSRYPGGMALRFARVLRYRDDKPPEEADTIDTVRALHDAGRA
ncbi:MAG TPA: ATP-dependent DNA ligase [Nocardioidaceae bacterium]|nr:ATP-dependent DNA ligase [Nocardioidaceae bacterium]